MNKTPRFRRLLGVALLATALVVGGSIVGPTWAVPSYPTWAEVQEAKRNVAKKKELIARFNVILADQAKEEDVLSKAALVLGEKYNDAKEALDLVAAKVATLQGQADLANAQAEAAKNRLAQIASQMYRNGSSGNGISLLLQAGKADHLLYQLGATDRLAQQNDTTYRKSIEKQRYAQSITDQLKVAKADMAAKAKEAKALYDEAAAAAASLQAKIAANEAAQKTFYAQLAVLQNTSATLERQRAEGLAAEARQNAGTEKPVAPELYDVGDPNTRKVDIAINFAKEQLGERYVLGGMGPNVWDCSGITKASYAAAGEYIGTHSATNQFNQMAAERKLVPLSQAVRGDLMWYSQSSSFNGDKYHVVIYLGNDMMLEAPNPARTVRIVPLRYGELFPYAGRPSA